jgi:hypothetical protein
MIRSFIALSLLLVLQTVSAAQLPGAPASIEGIVVRAGANQPLEGARVTLIAVTASTSAGMTSPIVTGARRRSARRSCARRGIGEPYIFRCPRNHRYIRPVLISEPAAGTLQPAGFS